MPSESTSLAVTHLRDPQIPNNPFYDERCQMFVNDSLYWRRSCRLLYTHPYDFLNPAEIMKGVLVTFSAQQWQDFTYFEKSILYGEAYQYD